MLAWDTRPFLSGCIDGVSRFQDKSSLRCVADLPTPPERSSFCRPVCCTWPVHSSCTSYNVTNTSCPIRRGNTGLRSERLIGTARSGCVIMPEPVSACDPNLPSRLRRTLHDKSNRLEKNSGRGVPTAHFPEHTAASIFLRNPLAMLPASVGGRVKRIVDYLGVLVSG